MLQTYLCHFKDEYSGINLEKLRLELTLPLASLLPILIFPCWFWWVFLCVFIEIRLQTLWHTVCLLLTTMNQQAQLGAVYGATLQGLATLGEGGRVYRADAVKN